MTSDDDVSRRERKNDQIEFFATLPSSVDPTEPLEVHRWLNQLGEALSSEPHVDVREKAPPGDRAADARDPGVWFAITTGGPDHPICPGKIPGAGDDQGEDDDSGGDQGGGDGG